MKTIRKSAILFLTLLAFEVISGCGKDIIPGTVLERSIVPNVMSEAMTKADDPEALVALKSSGFKMDIVSDNDFYAGPAGKYGGTRTVSWNADKWVISPDAYWLNKVNMRFWAYNLSNTDGLDITEPVASSSSLQFSYNTDKADKDLMMAYNSKEHPSTTHTSGGAEDQIDLHFHRALSKICFETGDFHVSLSDYHVSSITIGKLASSGSATFNGTSFSWTPGSTSSYYTTSGATAIDNSFYVIPQSITAGKVTFQVTLSSNDPSTKPDIVVSKMLDPVVFSVGKYYKYRISVNNARHLSLSLTVADWDLDNRTIEFKPQNVETTVSYDAGKSYIQDAAKQIIIKNGLPVEGSFKVIEPKGAKLMLALDGNLDAFEVSPKMTIIDGNVLDFTITPLVHDPKIDYHTQLHVYLIKADGTAVPVDDEVLGTYKDYTIVLPRQ